MSHVRAFEATIQKTHEWLKGIARPMGWDDEERAWKALRAVLQTLRDRLPAIEASHLGAQLPILVRGVYYESWTPLDKPVKMSRNEFLERVHEAFRHDPAVDPLKVTRTVVDIVGSHIDAGLLSKIAGELPAEFAEFWPVGVI